jgi:anti-sigma factor RsiW
MNRKMNHIQTEEFGMPESRKSHPEEELLERYAMGRLAEPQLGEVEEHLLICQGCQERLDEATAYTAILRQAAANVAAQPQAAEAGWRQWLRLEWLPMPMPALAGAMAVLAIALVWQPWRTPGVLEWRTVELETMRGGGSEAAGMEGFGLALRLDVSGLVIDGATGQIVSADGQVVAEGTVAMVAGKAEFRHAPGLAAGRYWVRLKKNGETLREYALVVRNRGV